MSNFTVELNSENFEKIALGNDKPVLVDFWATWCGPCKMMAKPIDEVAEETAGKIVVAKLDVDQAMDIAQEYGIQGVPTLILFQNGQVAARSVGLRTKKQILEMLAQS